MPSSLEAAFDTYWRALEGPEMEPEYRFAAIHSGGTGKGLRARLKETGLQDWRFDRANVEAMVAVELEGGTWTRGRHVQPKGFENDCRKYNAAAILGWTVFRLTGSMLKNDPYGNLTPIIAHIKEKLNAAI